MTQYKTIAESNNFIVLDKYTKHSEAQEAAAVYLQNRHWSENSINQGYENPTHLTSIKAMLTNVRTQLQTLNNMAFTDGEWARFVEEYLDRPSDNLVDKIRK